MSTDSLCDASASTLRIRFAMPDFAGSSETAGPDSADLDSVTEMHFRRSGDLVIVAAQEFAEE